MLIDRHWMSDGTNFYRLRVSVHRDRRYIKTNIRVKRNELSSDGRLKIAEKRRSLENLVRKTEEIVSTIDCYSLPSMNLAGFYYLCSSNELGCNCHNIAYYHVSASFRPSAMQASTFSSICA